MKMLILIKSQQMITKVSKNIQRAKSYSHVRLLKLFTVLFLLHKLMPNLNKYIQLCTKSRIKTKKLANRKKKNEKNIYLNATGLEPTSSECLNTRLSTRLSGNYD